jgi:hypothetical protein
MTCFACEREPTRQCPRCGRPYCDEHGEDVCDACLHPSSGVPSFTLYRGSLLALLIGTAIAAWLILQPSNGESSTALKPVVLTPTAVARGPAGGTPPANQTVVTAGSPVPGTTPPVVATTPGAPTTPAANTTPPAATTPGANTTPPAGTPAAGATPAGTPRPATPAAGTGSYTVVSGDSLTSICQSVKPASMSTSDCVDRIVALNNFKSANDSIAIGQQLTVPK